MADFDKLPAWQWILFIAHAATPTVWVPVACLDSNEINNTNDPIDTTSKCDDGDTSSIPGPNSWTMAGSGFSVDDRGGSIASFLELYKSFKSKEILGVRFARKDADAAGAWLFEGKGIMTSLNQTADNGDSVKFDVEFQGIGALNIGGSY